MKLLSRLGAMLLSLALLCALAVPAFAAAITDTTIDHDAECALTLYKYDITAAEADGFVPGSVVSTGQSDSSAEAALAPYAVQGVEFTYVRIADLITYSFQESGGYKVMNLYSFPSNSATAAFLDALGLTRANAYREVGGELDFVPDVVQAALAHKLADNATVVKNALEALAVSGGTAMPETTDKGRSHVEGLAVGLYLLVETRLPEQVTGTTDPCLISLPMTTVDGSAWNYDVTIYPKNQTGEPNLEKTLRESKPDTGKHNGSDTITDGYAHTGTGSEGDIVDYQITSTLPVITSNATSLTTYTFLDTLSKGLDYNKNDVRIAWFRDAACTDKITEWTEADGKFTASYAAGENGSSTMEIAMTADGLREINSGTAVHGADSTERGYSRCTLRITYTCTLGSDADTVLGDNGNPNDVVLTWKRTNENYYDTLKDDAHVYTYGLELTKLFSDNKGDHSKVQFKIHNDTDNYYVRAELNEEQGIYYVADHVATEDDATCFVPVKDGKVIVRGLEDDAYTITEVHTDAPKYTLLDKAIKMEIITHGNGHICPVCGKEGVTATAKVNGDGVAMKEADGSVAALVPFEVINIRTPEIPKTGDSTMLGVLCAAGMLSLCGMLLISMYLMRHKKAWEESETC